jgi:hypothetical protein
MRIGRPAEHGNPLLWGGGEYRSACRIPPAPLGWESGLPGQTGARQDHDAESRLDPPTASGDGSSVSIRGPSCEGRHIARTRLRSPPVLRLLRSPVLTGENRKVEEGKWRMENGERTVVPTARPLPAEDWIA